MKKPAIIALAIFFFFSLTGQACTLFGNPEAERATSQRIELNYWRVFDGSDTMDEIIRAYSTVHPNVTINYRSFRYDEYEQELLDALAEDRGPDIFSIPSTWVTKYQNKIEPMPRELKVGFTVLKGTIRKVETSEIRTLPGYTSKNIHDTFVTTVGDDVLRTLDGQERVMGLPLSVDTLSLFYNRDLLNNAGIAEPPKDWDQFAQDVTPERLTVRNQDNDKEILQAGVAMGTAKNTQRASDIVAALMMQAGAEMTSNGEVKFDDIPGALQQRGEYPGVKALQFYTDFAFPGKEVYSWNEDMPDNFEAFSQGRAAFFLGYSYHASQLRDTAPRLRVGVVPLPQLSDQRRFTAANYWVETVSKKTKEKDYAWDFLMFASSAEQVKSYLAKTEKPTALRSLIAEQKKNDLVAPFAEQLLYAVSWYRGATPDVAEKAFLDMITGGLAVKGGNQSQEESQLRELVTRAAQTIQSSY